MAMTWPSPSASLAVQVQHVRWCMICDKQLVNYKSYIKLNSTKGTNLKAIRTELASALELIVGEKIKNKPSASDYLCKKCEKKAWKVSRLEHLKLEIKEEYNRTTSKHKTSPATTSPSPTTTSAFPEEEKGTGQTPEKKRQKRPADFPSGTPKSKVLEEALSQAQVGGPLASGDVDLPQESESLDQPGCSQWSSDTKDPRTGRSASLDLIQPSTCSDTSTISPQGSQVSPMAVEWQPETVRQPSVQSPSTQSSVATLVQRKSSSLYSENNPDWAPTLKICYASLHLGTPAASQPFQQYQQRRKNLEDVAPELPRGTEVQTDLTWKDIVELENKLEQLRGENDALRSQLCDVENRLGSLRLQEEDSRENNPRLMFYTGGVAVSSKDTPDSADCENASCGLGEDDEESSAVPSHQLAEGMAMEVTCSVECTSEDYVCAKSTNHAGDVDDDSYKRGQNSEGSPSDQLNEKMMYDIVYIKEEYEDPDDVGSENSTRTPKPTAINQLESEMQREVKSTKPDRDSLHKCSVCRKVFTRKCNLQIHMRLHTGHTQYACSICSRKFNHPSNLNRHILTHDKHEPQHVCKTCRKRYKTNRSLQNHMRTHNDERPFSCSVCAETFKWRSSLKYHKRKHKRVEKS